MAGAVCLPSAFYIRPLLSALCNMPLALCCPVRFYLLFVSGSWCVSVPCCVICCNNFLHSCILPCAQCMPFAICPPLSALCVVLWGGAFALPRRLCVCVFLCVASMFCSLLPFASSLAICCPVLPSDDLRRACVCVPLHTNQNGKMCSTVLHCFG